jgi:hypothetical protein
MYCLSRAPHTTQSLSISLSLAVLLSHSLSHRWRQSYPGPRTGYAASLMLALSLSLALAVRHLSRRVLSASLSPRVTSLIHRVAVTNEDELDEDTADEEAWWAKVEKAEKVRQEQAVHDH